MALRPGAGPDVQAVAPAARMGPSPRHSLAMPHLHEGVLRAFRADAEVFQSMAGDPEARLFFDRLRADVDTAGPDRHDLAALGTDRVMVVGARVVADHVALFASREGDAAEHFLLDQRRQKTE